MKQKSIIVSEGTHTKFKDLCKSKNLKIGAVVEDLIILYVSNPKVVQQMIEEMKK